MSINFEAFGLVAYPLLVCSFMGLMLILERVIFFVGWRADGRFNQVCSIEEAGDLLKKVNPKNRLSKGVHLLLVHSQKNKTLREEIMNHWMSAERTLLFKHFAWFVLLAVISPMLGLLGTVLGIIQVFTAIASHTGPVTPALLAQGLGQAMLTTAAGLIIALPILVVMHSLRIWANERLTAMADALNTVNLLLDGISVKSVKNQPIQKTEPPMLVDAT